MTTPNGRRRHNPLASSPRLVSVAYAARCENDRARSSERKRAGKGSLAGVTPRFATTDGHIIAPYANKRNFVIAACKPDVR